MLTALMDQRKAAAAWLLGGLPLLVSSLQSLSALLGNETLYWMPLIGGIAEDSTSIPVVQEAAIIFYGQTTIVLLLFVLIALAWIVQGVLMFSQTGRRKSYSKTGSAGSVLLSALLYGFLFFGIYSALFTSSVGLVQVLVFFMIPILATTSLGIAYRTYSWKDQRRAEAIARLKSAQRQAKSQKRTMDTALEELPLAKIEDISPDAVREATSVKEEFYDECNTITQEVKEELDSSNETAVDNLEKTAQSLEQQSAALDATKAVSDLEGMLRQALDGAVKDRFGDLRTEFTSNYSERFKTANLPEELRAVPTPNTDEKIIISTASKRGVANQLENVISHNELPLVDAIELLDDVDSRIHDEVLPHLHQHEEDFGEIEDRVGENLDKAARKILDIGGHTGNALDQVFLQGSDSETSSAKQITNRLEDARERLHECELEIAMTEVSTAEAMSEEYLEAVQFVRNVLIPSINREKEVVTSIPHPSSREHSFFTNSLVDRLREPIRNDYAAEIELDLTQSRISIDYDVEVSMDEEFEREPSDSGDPRDEVKYLIRELQSSAGEGDVPTQGTISLDSLPSSVEKSNPVPEFVEFLESVDALSILEHPTELAESTTSGQQIQNDGYISIESEGGEPINRIANDLVDEYRAWAASNGDG